MNNVLGDRRADVRETITTRHAKERQVIRGEALIEEAALLEAVAPHNGRHEGDEISSHEILPRCAAWWSATERGAARHASPALLAHDRGIAEDHADSRIVEQRKLKLELLRQPRVIRVEKRDQRRRRRPDGGVPRGIRAATASVEHADAVTV